MPPATPDRLFCGDNRSVGTRRSRTATQRVTAIRDIEPGEELTYEYNLHDSDDDDADCHCGAGSCRGTMFSADEVKRRARRAKKNQAGKKQAKKS